MDAHAFLLWLWNVIGYLIEKWNYYRAEYRKRWGDWKWIDVNSKEPQILRVYYVRPGEKFEPWGCEVYRRWNQRLRDKKQLHGSEWFLPQYVSKYHGIVVLYRFRDQEWVDSFNWYRELVRNELEGLRSWVFPVWNSDTWKQNPVRVKFPVGMRLRGEEFDVSDWKRWFGPEGQMIRRPDRKRNYMTWFHLEDLDYLLEVDEELIIDWGIEETKYIWKLDLKEE